jgi:uncharacterized protein YhdP
VSLSGNDVRILNTLPVFEKAQGSISFTESGFSLSGITAQFLGGPIKFDGGSRKLPAKSSEANPLIRVQGQVTANGLRQAQEIPFLSLLGQQANGSTNYTASVGIKGGQSELSIQSQLQGMAFSLPVPLNKRADDLVALRFENTIQNFASAPSNKATRDLLQFSWGRTFSASYNRDISGSEPRVLNGRWVAGDMLAPNPSGPTESGVVANMALPSLSLDDWVQVFVPPKNSPQHNTAQNSLVSSAAQAYLPTRLNHFSHLLLVVQSISHFT